MHETKQKPSKIILVSMFDVIKINLSTIDMIIFYHCKIAKINH